MVKIKERAKKRWKDGYVLAAWQRPKWLRALVWLKQVSRPGCRMKVTGMRNTRTQLGWGFEWWRGHESRHGAPVSSVSILYTICLLMRKQMLWPFCSLFHALLLLITDSSSTHIISFVSLIPTDIIRHSYALYSFILFVAPWLIP